VAQAAPEAWVDRVVLGAWAAPVVQVGLVDLVARAASEVPVDPVGRVERAVSADRVAQEEDSNAPPSAPEAHLAT